MKFDEYVKEQVKAKLERVYCMNVLADKKGVVLSRNQKTAVSDAAEEYYTSLSDEKRNEFNITKEKLVNMFTSFAIADTLYNDLTDNLDIEVSYDEARVITVQYICADTLEDIKKHRKDLIIKKFSMLLQKIIMVKNMRENAAEENLKRILKMRLII